MKLNAINTTGTKNTHTVSDAVFGFTVNQPLLAQAIRVYTYNEHQSTSRVKTRAEVRRTKKKWFKQKGTGNARHAARSAPIFVGGGVAHGPKGLSTANLSLSQQQKHQALKSALTVQIDSIIVTEGIENSNGKTSQAHKFLHAILADEPRTLVVIANRNDKVEQAFGNIQYVWVTTAEHVTALDVIAADKIIFSPEAITALENRMSAVKSAKKPMAKAATVKAPVVKKEKVVAPKVVAVKKAATVKKTAAPAKKVTKKPTATKK